MTTNDDTIGGTMRYGHMSTNADSLNEGDALTREQIDALAQVEHTFTENRTFVDADEVERVLHAFMCNALGSCVCRDMRPTTTPTRVSVV